MIRRPLPKFGTSAVQWLPADDPFDGMPALPVPDDQVRARRLFWRPWIKRYQLRSGGAWAWVRPYDWIYSDVRGEYHSLPSTWAMDAKKEQLD